MISHNINNNDNNKIKNNDSYFICDIKLNQLLSNTETIGTIGSP